MIAVDITVLNGVHVGTPVVLWGVGLPVEEIARYAERLPTSCCVE
jgi:alanine racemase